VAAREPVLGPSCSRSERGPDGPGTAANRDDSGWPLAILPGTAVVTACPGLAAYESRYEPATMPGFTAGGHAGGQPAISGQIRGPDERARSGRGGGRGRGRPPRHRRACSSLNAGYPKPVSITSPCSRRAALSAALRFSARGDSVRYLYSTLLARQQRLLSLFTADRLEAVRVGNAAEAWTCAAARWHPAGAAAGRGPAGLAEPGSAQSAAGADHG